MRSLHARIVTGCLLLSSLAAPLHAAPVFARLSSTGARVLASSSALRGSAVVAEPGAALLSVDADAVAAFRAAGGGTLSVPDASGGTVELELTPLDILGPDGAVSYTDRTGRHTFRPDVTLYRGHVAGEPASWVVLSMGASGVLGTVERSGVRWTLSPTQRMATGAPGGLGVHAFAPEGSLAEAASRFECGINADNETRYMPPRAPGGEFEQGLTTSPNATEINGARFTFKVAVDCDQEIYSVKFGGDLNAATSYILTVLGTVNLIYERDLEATLTFPYVNLWTVTDPYTQPTTGAELDEFQAYWMANRADVVRDVAHLISGRGLGGGIAYISAICGGAPGYGVSAIDAAYAYPTATTTWDVEVIAHELGHNFGSYHTHSCQWAAEGRVPLHSTLDSCVTPEGGCLSYTNHLPPDKGTIMSYCHLIGGVANGIRLDFHPVCVSRMRGVMSGCGILNSLPPRNPIATTIPTGVRLSWTPGGASGVLRYSVVRSRLPLDLNPGYIGNTPLTQFDTPGLGTYYYRVRAVRLADSSVTSAEVKATVCSFTSTAPVTVGSQPTAAVSEDVNEDGIQDVVLVTTGGGNLVTLLGQGAGGVGNGSFAAPVNVTTGATPACLALLDVNADGILDAVVGAQGDNTLQLHLGQGAAGVGNGTFGPATLLATLSFAPTGIAVGDFDEDGIADLAVGGGATFVTTLKGQGTAGVASGTFDAPVAVNAGSTTRGVLAYDWNGDGITDLVASGGGVRMLFGNGSAGKGDGTFALGPSYSVGSTPNQMAVADFNADGVADLAVCNTGASSVSVLLGNSTLGVPDGTFAGAIAVTSGTGPNAVNIGDWDHNGIPDMAIASSSANASTVLLGNGNGTFEPGQPFATGGSGPAFLAVNDYNEDGTPDFLACNRLSQSVTRQLAGCPGVLSNSIVVTAPNGGESWTGGTEHALAWTKGAGVMTVDVQRSDDGGANWRTLARGLTGTSYAWTTAAPWTTTARIRVVDSHAAQFADASDADFAVTDPSIVGVGGDEPPALALLGAWPNPARADLSVSLSLPSGDTRGALELLDLSGRRVAYRDLAGLGAGRHQVTLLERRSLAPGVYLVRLTRGGEVRSLKVAVLQ